jgi:hexokinase
VKQGGIATLTDAELQEACKERCIESYSITQTDLTKEQMVKYLQEWIDHVSKEEESQRSASVILLTLSYPSDQNPIGEDSKANEQQVH